MEWIVLIGCIAAVLILLGLKRVGGVSPELAQKYLQQGAKIIDVRSPEEYQAGNLPGAINIPMSSLAQGITRHASDKNQVLLVHCLSGGRSGLAVQMLRRMGYKNSFNLGSFPRAQKIISGNCGKDSR